MPRDADRVIFFPRAAGGAEAGRDAMLLALSATAIVIVALLWEVLLAAAHGGAASATARAAARSSPTRGCDPGRERRAEQRARELLQSCVNDEEWAMYRDLGFLRVWGALADGPGQPGRAAEGAPYAYLDLPAQADRRLPAADARAAQRVLRRVPGRDAPLRLGALPDSDDVLAKWMALTGDEQRLITTREHAPAGPPDRPEAESAATSGA